MKILAVGDIVGENGLNKLKEELPKIIDSEKIDFVIVNAENTSGGMGLTIKDFNILLKMKIDAITMGNHTWGKKDIFAFIDNPKLIRPANYSKGIPGKGYNIFECKGKKIAVISHGGSIKFLLLNWCDINKNMMLEYNGQELNITSPCLLKLIFKDENLLKIEQIYK